MSHTNLITRRRLFTAAGVFSLALAATPRVAGAQATPVASPAATTPAAADAFPVTITHAFGETTIPALPERIVLTDENAALDSLLALDVQPAAMMLLGGYIGELAPWAINAGAGEIPVIPGTADGEIDFEAIAAAQPDLILTSWATQDTYDTLSTIAPTIVYKASDSETWQDIQRTAGLATGRSVQAEAVIAETEALIAAQQPRLDPYQDLTVAVAYFWFDQFLVNGKDAPIGRILAAYGLDVVSPGSAEAGSIDMLSLEQINVVDGADVIIAADFLPDQTAAQEANALFRALPAMQRGGYILLPPEMAQALYLESSLSTQWAVPQLVDAVIEGAEGKGKRLNAKSE
ncbi:MAG: ABC transporter substrate-binding protein [Thermomicrobiales bacterium]